MQKLVFPFKTIEHLGIFETPSDLASFLVKNALDRHFNKARSMFLKAMKESNDEKIAEIIRMFLNFKACDPMMGSGIFIKELIRYMLELRNWFILKSNGILTDSRILKKYAIFAIYSEKNFSEYLVTHSLYGVELNKENLDSWKSFLQELFPNNSQIVDFNFKQGNSLIDSLEFTSYNDLIGENQKDISNLVSWRKKLQNGEITPFETESLKKTKLELISKIKNSTIFNLIPKKIMKDFLAWYVEFPEIFFDESGKLKTNPGFDLIVGNPPWKNLKPDDREFFENYFPRFSSLKRIQRDAEKKKLMEKSEISSNYKLYLDSIKQYSKYFSESGIYKYQGNHNHDFYKLSLERFYQLARTDGIIGSITPLGIATDLGTRQLRKIMLENCTLFFIIGFEPKSKFFENADVSPSISLYRKGGSTKNLIFANGFVSPNDVELEKIPEMSVEFIRKTAPSSMSIPSIRSKFDISILEKMYSFPTLGTIVDNTWNIEFARELDETNDRHLFRTKKTAIPLVKGANVGPFKIKKSPFIWVDETEFKKISKDYKSSRIAWRDVARPNLKKRLVAALIPSGCALGNSLNYIRPNIPEILKYFLLGFLNSSIVEYRIKQMTSNSHINQFVIKQLPVPRLRLDDPILKKISKLSMILYDTDLDESESSITIKKIDELISQIYDLNSEEITHIWNSFAR